MFAIFAKNISCLSTLFITKNAAQPVWYRIYIWYKVKVKNKTASSIAKKKQLNNDSFTSFINSMKHYLSYIEKKNP